MSRELLFSVGAGLTCAVLAIAVPFAAPLPLFLAGLGLGITGLLVAGAATLAAALLAGGLPAVLSLGAITVVPVLLLVRQALLAQPGDNGGTVWYPAERLVLLLTGLATALVALGIMLLAGHPGGPEAAVGQTMTEYGQVLLEQGVIDDPAMVGMLTAMLTPVLPGTMGAMWMAMMAMNGSLAQNILVRSGRNLRPATDLAMFRLPTVALAPVAVAAGLAMTMDGTVAWAGVSFAIVFAMPWFFCGLAVVHVASRRWPARPLVLAGFYGLVVMLGGLAGIVVVMLGVAEHWLDLRSRLTGAAGRGPGGPGS